MSIPFQAGDVTPAWLSHALSTDEGCTKVREVEHLQLIRGAGTKLFLRLEYEENPRNLPERLWVKAGWEEHSSLMAEMGVYAREAMFFARYAPLLNVRAPLCYWVEQDSDGRSGMILEDLHARGAQLWSCTVPRCPDDLASLLEGLASVHARFWQSPELATTPGIDVLVEAVGPKSIWPRQCGGKVLEEIVAGPRGKLFPQYARAPDRIEKAFWRMVETLDRRNGRCLLHGDPHPGNCFTDTDGVSGLYDWQTLTRGPWAFDVSYSVTTALSPADRRHHERDLLAHYLSALSRLSIDPVPDFETAWDDYCRYVAHPLFIWTTNRSSHQDEENILALTERVGAAASDFRVFERWGA